MSVLRDLMKERLNWEARHRATVAHHQVIILVAELILLAGTVLCMVIYHEAIVVLAGTLFN